MSVHSFQELTVWQKGLDLVEEIYRLARLLPKDERFGLTQQMRRSAVSIPANIAEGYGRHHRGEYLHHLSFALGSLRELETHLHICRGLGFLEGNRMKVALGIINEIGGMPYKMSEKLRLREE